MSESELGLEPVPVVKDPGFVNGDDVDDFPPPVQDLHNGVNKPAADMSNGVDHEHELDVDHERLVDAPVNGDVNGDEEGEEEGEEEDLMGGEMLPPPPAGEVMSELPPPPGIEGDLLMDTENIEPEPHEDEDVVGEEEGEIDEGNVDEVEDEDVELEDNVKEHAKEEDYSEEELVSDGGLKDEVNVEIQDNVENECVEQGGEEQFVNVGQDESLVDLAEPEPMDTPVPLDMLAEPEMLPEPEVVTQEEMHPEPEKITEPAHIEKAVEPEPEPEDEPVVDELEPQVSQEVVDVQSEPVAEPQTLVGYAEPAIITDNKPVDEEPVIDEPPPPPPPLTEETPPPPPPLDESVQLKRDSRRSGGSTPNKQSPCKELDSPIVEEAPKPAPEPVREQSPESVQQEPVKAEKPAPIPVPVAVPESAEVKQAEIVEAEDVSIPGSPPRSPSNVSDVGSDLQAQEAAHPSPKITKKNFKSKIKFGVDLLEVALKQLSFLSCVNKHNSLYEEWLFKKALRRYEAFWLPMAAEHKKESLAAPLDVEWVWHCHMLAPLAYEADCKKIVGLVVEHKVICEKDRTKALEKSRKYWAAKYPNEPFEIELVYKEKVEEPVVVVETETKPTPAENTEACQEQAAEQNTEAVENEQKAEPQTGEAEPNVEGGASTEATPPEGEGQDTPAAPAEPAAETPAPEPVPEPAEATPEPPEATPAPVNLVPEEGYEQKSHYNIFSSILRQQVFNYQVSLQHYHDKSFLKAAVKRYQKFLFLKHQNPSEALVPCYDVDLIWHGHQLHPGVYRHDTVKVLGQLLSHDDSVNDRSSGSRLMRADKNTRDLWKALYDEEFMVFGAMFRGEPPVLCEKMTTITPDQTYHFSTKKAMVNLDKVQVEGLPEEVNKYSVRLTYGANDKEGPMIKMFKGNKKKMEFENTKKGLAKFVFDTKEFNSINFDMTSQYGFACTGHSEEIGRQVFNLMPVVESIPKDQSEATAFTESVVIEEENNLKAIFTANIDPPSQGPTMLFLNQGSYETRFCIIPEQIIQMWGPVPLPRLPTGRDNSCLVASHKFVNHTGETTFTCRVIHSLPLLMSAVQVFYQGHIAAVAHLVGSDQIPLPGQLSDTKKIFSMNPGDDQRAVLIKNQSGDWGLVRGQWTGFRKHQSAVAATKGKKAKKEVPWCPGTLNVSFYKISTSTWQHLHLPYLQNDFKYSIQDAAVDIKSGTIQVNSEPKEVAENVALVFAISLLHVLCQPRYTPPPPPEPVPIVTEQVQQEEKKEEEEKVKEKEEEKKEDKEEEEKKEGEGEVKEAQEGESDKAKEDGAEASPTQEVAQAEAPAPATPKTPKSPVKSEPATPSKKMKEIPPIPTCELALIIAAGYQVETPTTELIKHQYGLNACAGCVGIEAGVGQFGKPVQAQPETQQPEAGCENGKAQDSAKNNDAEANDSSPDAHGDATDNLNATDGEMEAMGDVGGDAGAAACGSF